MTTAVLIKGMLIWFTLCFIFVLLWAYLVPRGRERWDEKYIYKYSDEKDGLDDQ